MHLVKYESHIIEEQMKLLRDQMLREVLVMVIVLVIETAHYARKLW